MGELVIGLKTDPELLDALEKATSAKPSQDELMEQRVSFIVGSLDDESDVTRERIKQILQESGTVAR